MTTRQMRFGITGRNGTDKPGETPVPKTTNRTPAVDSLVTENRPDAEEELKKRCRTRIFTAEELAPFRDKLARDEFLKSERGGSEFIGCLRTILSAHGILQDGDEVSIPPKFVEAAKVAVWEEEKKKRTINEFLASQEKTGDAHHTLWSRLEGYERVVVGVVVILLATVGIILASKQHHNERGSEYEQSKTQIAATEKADGMATGQPMNTKGTAYKKGIYAQDDAIEDAVVIKAADIINSRNNAGPIHITQMLDIYDWMKANIQYLSVPEGSKPRKASLTLSAGKGDCKNIAALLAALELSIGARVAIAVQNGEVNEFGDKNGHAFVLVRIYKPTIEERQDETAMLEKFLWLKAELTGLIRTRYGAEIGQTIADNGIAIREDAEGLWLYLDATFGQSGYPGRIGKREIAECFKFGPEHLVPDFK